VSTILRQLCHTVRSKINYTEQHVHVLETLWKVLQAFKYDYEKGGMTFPYHLLDSYAVIVVDPLLTKQFVETDQNHLPPNRAVLLCLLGEWLGKEFGALRFKVNSKAEEFKLRHIESMDKLPPAKDLVAELFPKCMRSFLYNWMQTEEKRSPETEPPTSKKICQEEFQNIHPYVQLILEFANNTLVTGVAHVLYSSLLHA
jgi:hypothetical protein